MMLMLSFSVGNVFADDPAGDIGIPTILADAAVPAETATETTTETTSTVPAALSGFSITSPMETSAVAFWFPKTGTYAGGVSHTFLRLSHSAITFMSLDFDGTLAQEVNQDKDTLVGLGAKANFNTTKNTEKGFKFLPSIGVTALNNFSKFKALKDIVQNYDIAIYGTLLAYRW